MLKKIVFVNKNYYSFKNFRLPLAKKLLKKNPNYEIFSIFGGPGPKKKLKNIKCLSMKISQNLYDLKNDPNQLHNLANEKQFEKQKNKLKIDLEAWMKRTGDPRFTNPTTNLWDRYPYY